MTVVEPANRRPDHAFTTTSALGAPVRVARREHAGAVPATSPLAENPLKPGTNDVVYNPEQSARGPLNIREPPDSGKLTVYDAYVAHDVAVPRGMSVPASCRGSCFTDTEPHGSLVRRAAQRRIVLHRRRDLHSGRIQQPDGRKPPEIARPPTRVRDLNEIAEVAHPRHTR